jgi:hypothetical protein
MADANEASSESRDHPTSVGVPDPEDKESPPPDESYLVGATGVEEEVLAALARAEAEMNDPKHDAGDASDGAVI